MITAKKINATLTRSSSLSITTTINLFFARSVIIFAGWIPDLRFRNGNCLLAICIKQNPGLLLNAKEIASPIFVGIAVVLSAALILHFQAGQNASAADTGMMMGEAQLAKGQIASVQLGTNGQPEWIQSGFWVMRMLSPSSGSDQPTAWLIAKFSMVRPDGTAMHSHIIYNFTTSEMTMEGNSTNVLKGFATVTMKDGPVSGVPLTIKVYNGAVIGIWIGPDKVDGHFATSPIYGILSPHSRESMMMTGASMTKMQSLTNTSIPITIPLSNGLYDGKDVFFTTTEVSDSQQASMLTTYTKFHVTYAPALANAPPQALGTIFVFKNGVAGTGPMGFQPDVFDSIPGDSGYTPLWKVSFVEWKTNSYSAGSNATQPTILGSDNDIADAQSKGQVTVTQTNIVVNCPIIQWGGNDDGTIPAGHMKIREDTTLTDTGPYGGGQLLNIDTNKLQATFVGHRGFGPDGSTIYYIVTDASMQGPADMMGVIFTNRTAAISSSTASSDLFQFGNGIKGTGPMGFQAGIGSTLPGDSNYSPIWRIQMINWNDPASATMLTSKKDIEDHSNQIAIMPSGMVVNCPFVSPSG